MGYILQPHTSAGRIPSDKGYRLYVDELMASKQREVETVKEMMIDKTDRLEKVLKQVVKVLASKTNYASLITGPVYHQTRLKFIQLSRISDDQLVVVIVAEGNLMKNRIIDTEENIDDETLLKLNILLNNQLNGKTIGEINLDMISRMKQQAGIHSDVISSVVDAVAEVIRADEEELPVFTSGANNIFKYPELSDSEKASELISAFEDKKELVDMLRETSPDAEGSNETGIQVYIGEETAIRTMRDCSVVTASYDLGKGMRGTIGIIGPKRMDYENVVNSLNTLRKQLDSVFKKDDD
jgi:heat-inducible transcriptional repressor